MLNLTHCRWQNHLELTTPSVRRYSDKIIGTPDSLNQHRRAAQARVLPHKVTNIPHVCQESFRRRTGTLLLWYEHSPGERRSNLASGTARYSRVLRRLHTMEEEEMAWHTNASKSQRWILHKRE